MSESCVSGPGILDFVQAGAAVIAVFAGFAYVSFQRRLDAAAAGKAAGQLARHSIDLVTERLAALIDKTTPNELALRGARATEMIEAFRELELSKLPPEQIERVALIRSAVFAVNSRIDEVLKDDAKRQHERRERLYSAGRTLESGRTTLASLRASYPARSQSDYLAAAYSDAMADFVADALKPAKTGC